MWKSKSSVAVACFLPGRAKDLSAPLYIPKPFGQMPEDSNLKEVTATSKATSTFFLIPPVIPTFQAVRLPN